MSYFLTDNENVKSYKDRRKTSLQEEPSERTPVDTNSESDHQQKQQLLKQQQQQQEAEARRLEAIEREKREVERRLAEKREQERQEKLRKEREEAEKRAKEERARQQALAEQRQREEKALLEERLAKESSSQITTINTSNQKDRSHNHKNNNSASTSPVRGSNNKRRLSSPDAPLTNHLDSTSEVTKKTKSEQDNKHADRREASKDVVSCKSGSGVEKTPSKHHKKSEDRSSNKDNNSDVVSPDEKRHSTQDKDMLFDYLRTEHNKNEKHNKLNRKHSTTSTTSHQSKEESSTKEMHRDKENSQTENTMDNKAFFDAIELRSSEEEERLRAIRRETKERKDSQDTNKSTSGNSCDDGSSSHNKHESRKNSRSDNHPSSDDTSKKQQRSKTSRRNTVPETSHSHQHGPHHHHQQHSHTSDETDSDGRKKHSIFDIPDDGPYVSMYDKVKARSCKNMQKQEEEKKIKAKFGKLKRSRAKREGKKRSTSWDEDSDTDDDENPRYRRVNSKGLASSSDDEMHHHHQMSDSDQEKLHFSRNRLHELCEGESSDTTNLNQKPRRKISSRKNSRATRLALDSSDDEIKRTPIKTELKTEMISDDEEESKTELKINTSGIKQEMKHDDSYKGSLNTPVSAPAMIESKSAFDQLFGHESKKKHKKNKKRQKSFPMDSTDEDILPLSERRETEGEIPSAKSELDKSLEAAHDRRKHGSKKEKKREKTREEHERKKARKANKLMGKQQSLDNKREEKMEDIFGPVSDEESRQSPTNSVSPSNSAKTQSGLSAFDQLRDSSLRNPKSVDDHSQESQQRKQRKEKKRREKHKSTHSKEDENSVDLDEAGRALEAQLMSDTEVKTEDTHKNHEDSAADVFRFSEGDDSLDSSKKDTSEHRREKKKKKKKSKEEKHKHHHHNKNHDEKLLSPEPSLPSLVDDVNPNPDHQSKKASVPIRGNGMTSPPLLMDKKALATSSPLRGGDDSHNKQRKQSEIFIPGFGRQIDEKLHETAVLSIAQELESSRKPDVVTCPDPSKSLLDPDRPESPKTVDGKGEEKSRVVISQEETEDAVAALLGESFGTSNVQDYNEIFEEPVEEPPTLQEEPVIPEQDDEEMKKAIQSLNTDEMDIKADTPQSEHDLQIDTDTEEPEEQEKTSQFDNPPKTPDVDFAQLRKNAEKNEQDSKTVKSVSPLVARTDSSKTVVSEESAKKIPVSIPQVKFTPATSITTNANKPFSILQPPTIKIPEAHPPASTQQETEVTKSQTTLLSPRTIAIPTSSKQGPVSPRGAASSQQRPNITVDHSKVLPSQQSPVQQSRQMLSPSKGQQPSPGQIIFHSGQPGPINPPGSSIGQSVPLNRFPIVTAGGSKPIQPTNVLLPQPSQGTLSNTQKQGNLLFYV